MWQESLRDVCQDILAEIDGALGCAIVDLDTGLPLAFDVAAEASLSPVAMERLGAAGVGYFRADGGDDRVEQLQTTTEDAFHFMSRLGGGGQVLVLVADRGRTNLGLGWMSLRHAVRRVSTMNAREDAGLETDGPPGPAEDAGEPADEGDAEADVFAARSRRRRSIWD